MKRNIIISVLFFTIMLLTTNVKAAYIYADDIEDDSYIIGDYLLTRDKNTSAGYNGELTTQVMLLAARGIGPVYSLDNIKVYYKTFLGEWINGITGEALSFVPKYFDINVRNLKANLPKPELNCYVTWDSSMQFYCESNFFESKWTPGTSMPDRLYKNMGDSRDVEYYLLMDENGNLPETYVYQAEADKFRENNSSDVRYTPHLITHEMWENEMQDYSKFYQIVSRYYYLDGDKRIYSEYSDVSNNAVLSKLGLRYNTMPKVKASIVDTNMYVDSKDASNVIYYNVEFNLENVDTTKYIVRKYDVYTTDGQDYVVDSGQYHTALDLSDSVHWKMYNLNQEKEKWNLGNYFITTWRGFGMPYEGISYLTASIGSDLPYGNITDVSSEKTYSIRFDKEGETIGTDTIGVKQYYAKVYMCLKDDTSVCYYAVTEFGDHAHKQSS